MQLFLKKRRSEYLQASAAPASLPAPGRALGDSARGQLSCVRAQGFILDLIKKDNKKVTPLLPALPPASHPPKKQTLK